MLKTRTMVFLGLLPALLPLGLAAAERIDEGINARLRKEGLEHAQVMRTLHYLTDVYGPRLTGSPGYKAAAEWALMQMAEWGFENGHLEPWDFGHPGWVNERLSAHLVAPTKDALVCEALAWTNGTNGPTRGFAFHLLPPEGPTQEVLSAYLESVKEKVAGRMVLVGKQQLVSVNFNPSPKRMDEKAAAQRYDPNNPSAGQFGPPRPQQPQEPAQGPPKLTPAQINEQIDLFLVHHGALLRVNDAGREHGQIRAFNNRTFDPSKAVTTVVLRNEDYGRITRILADGTPVELEFDIVNRFYPEGKTSYNVIAEIPGGDLKEQVVMLGGHLDSWHAATGATDNAVGCAVMMEAARLIKAIGAPPRRTIRVALWAAEEQGLLGSQAYVKEHFGSFENPKPEYDRLAAYFNVDSGTGRARGMSVFGPPEAATILREILTPFQDLGVAGAIAGKSRALGGTDSTSFNQAGLPGIGIGQDPIEYMSATWHTNVDTYERVIEEDARKSAVDIAAAVYHLAMRDEMLPRFTKETMPALPAVRPPGQ